jgi:hypothetical protein
MNWSVLRRFPFPMISVDIMAESGEKYQFQAGNAA